MAVTSKDLENELPETGFIDEKTVAQWGILFVRLLVAFLLLFTLFGSFVPFAGGWEALRAAWARQAWGQLGWSALFAFLFQLVLTMGQWGCKALMMRWYGERQAWLERERHEEADYAYQQLIIWTVLYGVLLLVSSTPSAYTYTVWVAPLTGDLMLVSAIPIFIGCVIGDMIPEWVGVRRG